MRLRHEHLYAGGLRVSVRHRDDTDWSADLRFNETQDTLRFTAALNTLWARRPRALASQAPLRVSILFDHLLPSTQHTGDLFEAEKEKTRDKLNLAVDTLNQTFGKNSVYFGGAHGATGYTPMRIAFTRIPNPQLENIDVSRQRRLKPTPPPAPPSDFPENEA
jgi:DNA polymerase-4